MNNKTNGDPSVQLSNGDLIKITKQIVFDLAKTRGKSWMLSIPPNFNKDPDLLLIELVDRFEELNKIKTILEKKGFYPDGEKSIAEVGEDIVTRFHNIPATADGKL